MTPNLLNRKKIILCIWKKRRISDKDIVTIWYRNVLAKVTQYKGYIRFLRDILASILVILAKICKYRKSATLHFLTLKNHSIILPYNGYIYELERRSKILYYYIYRVYNHFKIILQLYGWMSFWQSKFYNFCSKINPPQFH